MSATYAYALVLAVTEKLVEQIEGANREDTSPSKRKKGPGKVRAAPAKGAERGRKAKNCRTYETIGA